MDASVEDAHSPFLPVVVVRLADVCSTFAFVASGYHPGLLGRLRSLGPQWAASARRLQRLWALLMRKVLPFLDLMHSQQPPKLSRTTFTETRLLARQTEPVQATAWPYLMTIDSSRSLRRCQSGMQRPSILKKAGLWS